LWRAGHGDRIAVKPPSVAEATHHHHSCDSGGLQWLARYTTPANRFLQRFLPFFRQFFFAWWLCCLRLQPFLTERLQHCWGDSPLLQFRPRMPKHWPLAVSQNGAAAERAAHSALEPQRNTLTLPPLPPPEIENGWQVPFEQVNPVAQSPPAQHAWPWAPHAAPAWQMPPWQIKGETQAPFGGQQAWVTAPDGVVTAGPHVPLGRQTSPDVLQAPPAQQSCPEPPQTRHRVGFSNPLQTVPGQQT
jgi:hypothetical protein